MRMASVDLQVLPNFLKANPFIVQRCLMLKMCVVLESELVNF